MADAIKYKFRTESIQVNPVPNRVPATAPPFEIFLPTAKQITLSTNCNWYKLEFMYSNVPYPNAVNGAVQIGIFVDGVYYTFQNHVTSLIGLLPANNLSVMSGYLAIESPVCHPDYFIDQPLLLDQPLPAAAPVPGLLSLLGSTISGVVAGFTSVGWGVSTVLTRGYFEKI
jgi:hypothetical protein